MESCSWHNVNIHHLHRAYNLKATEDIVIDRVISKSYISVLDQGEKDKLIHDIKVILNRGDGKQRINEGNGEWEYPQEAFVVLAKRL